MQTQAQLKGRKSVLPRFIKMKYKRNELKFPVSVVRSWTYAWRGTLEPALILSLPLQPPALHHGTVDTIFSISVTQAAYVCFCNRLFTRIMLDLPSLTDGAVMAVRMYCEDLVRFLLSILGMFEFKIEEM